MVLTCDKVVFICRYYVSLLSIYLHESLFILYKYYGTVSYYLYNFIFLKKGKKSVKHACFS